MDNDHKTDSPQGFSLVDMLADLDLGHEIDAANPGGMAWSWANPEAFHRVLATWDTQTSGPSKNRPFAQCDLYHDLVYRHRGSGRVAFRGWTGYIIRARLWLRRGGGLVLRPEPRRSWSRTWERASC